MKRKTLMKSVAAAAMCVVALSATADTVLWSGPGGTQDWNAATNWTDNVVPADDATVYIPYLAPQRIYFELTPPDTFVGTVVVSNYSAYTTDSYNSTRFSNILKLGVVDGAQWTVSGSGDLVATDGLAARLSSSFTGVIDVRKGTTFTAPATLNSEVKLVGAGRLILSSGDQLKQAAGFVGEIVLPSGATTCPSAAAFANGTVELANGTFKLDPHDILDKHVGTITSFSDEAAAWSYNGTCWTNGALASGPYSPAPPYLNADGDLILTDDPAQVHTVFYTNRVFRATDDWGMSFTWYPEMPKDSRIVKDGRQQIICGNLAIGFQRVSPTAVKNGKNRSSHCSHFWGFFVYAYAGDGNPHVAWECDGVPQKNNEMLLETHLNGINLRQPIDFTVSLVERTMVVTMIQGENSVSLTHNFATAITVLCPGGAWVGVTGSSDEWGNDYPVIPWIQHRIANFKGWYSDPLEGGWETLSDDKFGTFNADNWFMYKKSKATGTEIVKEDNACVNADGTVTLCEPAASNLTYLICKEALTNPHTRRIKMSYDIQGGAASYEANSAMRVDLLFGGKNSATWDNARTYSFSGYGDWLYGAAFNWNLTYGSGNFVASRMSADVVKPDGVRTGPTVNWVSRADQFKNRPNQKFNVDLLYDPIGRMTGIFVSEPVTIECGECTRVDWDVPADYVGQFEHWRANRAKVYIGIHVTAAGKNYTEMTLKRVRVQAMTTADAGRMPGSVRVGAGNSATLAAGEAMSGQAGRVVTAANVELESGSSLTVSPATNNATIVGMEKVTATGAGTLAAASGAAVEVEDLVLTGTAGQSSLTVAGGVSFPAAITVTIPDEWQDYTDRIALVDGSAAASPFPSTARVMTAGGTDVTEKAHFAVRNGIASICFAQGTMILFR